MSQDTEFTFRTKTGACTITPDQIILTRGGARGAVAAAVYGNSIGRSLVLYSLLGGAALLSGLWSISRGSTFSGLIMALIGAFFLWSVYAGRNNSAAGVIPRAAIRRVEAHPPLSLLTRGYFDVFFTEDGKERRRIIALPGSLSDGENEYQRAKAVMRAAGLLDGEPDGASGGAS